MIETILVATDGSADASAAEQTAMGLASRLGARLLAVAIVDDRLLRAPAGDGLALPSFPEAEISTYYRARAEAVARRFSERARGEGLAASCEVLQGIPDARIVEKVQGADLLLVGRTGTTVSDRGGLVGATVDSILRKTNKPTIVVPAGAPLTGPLVLGFDGSPGSRIAAKIAVTLANGLNEAVHVCVDSKDKGRAVARFDEVRQLIEVGKECDELSRETGSADSLEEFGNIVTFFDRFDNVYHTVNRLAFHEEEKLPDDKLRSLLQNKKIFDEIQENLFHDLFIVPVMKNLYLPRYGRKKIESFFEEISNVETGDRSLQDVIIFMEDLTREEREYRIVKTAMDRWLKKFGRSLKGLEEETSFISDVRKMLVSRGLVRPDVPEIFFRQTLEDLKTERIYFGSILPRAIKARDPSGRSEFINSSGIDMMRIEELERDFQQQYRISDDLMDTIRSTRSEEDTHADGRS